MFSFMSACHRRHGPFLPGRSCHVCPLYISYQTPAEIRYRIYDNFNINTSRVKSVHFRWVYILLTSLHLAFSSFICPPPFVLAFSPSLFLSLCLSLVFFPFLIPLSFSFFFTLPIPLFFILCLSLSLAFSHLKIGFTSVFFLSLTSLSPSRLAHFHSHADFSLALFLTLISLSIFQSLCIQYITLLPSLFIRLPSVLIFLCMQLFQGRGFLFLI